MSPTRFLILSDLHQNDGGRLFDPAAEITAPFDVAIVAGDCAGRLTSSIAWLGERFAGTPTIYVPGNHDFYRSGGPFGFTFENELAAGRDLAARLGVTLLSDDVAHFGDIRILGSTLWTDLRSRQHASRRHAFAEANRWMNDFRFIHRNSSTRRSRRITPNETLDWHRASMRFLGEAFADGDDPARTIVVTHHAPSPRSLSIPDDRLNHCYASDLESEIASWCPALWVHGHIHAASDYRIGATRIIANPLGRADERSGFDANFVTEV
ncbi:putative phosphoesterase [Fulvimarina pelagi HTCC2506]|uniref:Putative phosphoesterase n=1 Tax=Fulvimarina pelagi HTCC2506 TaxID=314231 RepID=Q0G280_9HYPH|nr:metallophosphoesterase [Fulvimarina pelagi]EAU41318.1 putative phosphoesterase [Fulvimarina pelagi HTCC2506]